MKSEDILHALSEVDEELIERASKKMPHPFWRWSGLAAALVLVVGIAYVVFHQGNLKAPTPPTKITETPETQAPEIQEPATEEPATEAPETDSPIFGGDQIAGFDAYYSLDYDDGISTYNAVVESADAYGAEVFFYHPTEDSTEARCAAMEQAIEEGCNIVLTYGHEYGGALVETAPLHPEITFIGMDLRESDLTIDFTEDYPFDQYSLDNVLAVDFRSEIAGYLAGYSAVSEGYSSLGYYTMLFVAETLNYACGFAQGAQDAARETGRLDEILIKLTSEPYFYGEIEQIRLEKMTAWREAGTQLITTYGDSTLAQTAADVGADIVVSAGASRPDMYVDNIVYLQQDKKAACEMIFSQLFNGELTLGRSIFVPYYEITAPTFAQASEWREKYETVYSDLLEGARECPADGSFEPNDYEIDIIWE